MSKSGKAPTYEEALEELRTISEGMESGSFTMDEIPGKVRRAKELIELCRNKLKGIETEVSSLLEED